MTKKTRMASSTSAANNNSTARDLTRQIKSHEVAIAELDNLPATRGVYQKNGNILFRTTITKATASEQKQLELAKSKLKKLNSC